MDPRNQTKGKEKEVKELEEFADLFGSFTTNLLNDEKKEAINNPSRDKIIQEIKMSEERLIMRIEKLESQMDLLTDTIIGIKDQIFTKGDF